MHQKFIIVSEPGETRGILRMGKVISHRDLVVGYEKVHGGGWWLKDDLNKEIVLYGESGDYSEADIRWINMIPKEYREYRFFISTGEGPGKPLDLQDIEWV